MTDTSTDHPTPRKRLTRRERVKQLEVQLRAARCAERKEQREKNWRDLRILGYAMASVLQHVSKDSYGNVVSMAQRCLNQQDRAKLISILDRLGLPTATLSNSAQEPIRLRDCAWCSSAKARPQPAATPAAPKPQAPAPTPAPAKPQAVATTAAPTPAPAEKSQSPTPAPPTPEVEKKSYVSAVEAMKAKKQ